MSNIEFFLEHIQFLTFLGFACYSLGVISTLLVTRKGLKLSQIVALFFSALYGVFVSWSIFVSDKPLDFYVHAWGIASIFTLLGIETTEAIKAVLPTKK